MIEKKTPLMWHLPSEDMWYCDGIKEMPFLKTFKPYSFANPSIICSCNVMPSTIGKCKLFTIKHTTLLEGETFLRNKHKIAFFEIKYTFFLVEKKTPLVFSSVS